MILSCDGCLKPRLEPHKIIKPWPTADEVFERIHLDFAGPHKTYNRKTAGNFWWFGIPKRMVTNNGSRFTSKEMKTFRDNNGIKQLFAPPHHPNSNGAAENTVKSFKTGLNQALSDSNHRNVPLETL
ncbi:hypothetical protein ILUMI_00488 [Ignelater luminosus]|uniref:Integrase catalytic domain-containing protein n=1 Tax=Ignelater luminosus TaxID=2038154 RepID=A0A8K0DKB5_IGNLU|nr:hypothetical protein ILUMI_00488 [Ignelater luminosus]